MLKQGDRFQAGRRSRNRDRTARSRWSRCRAIRAWSCCPPGCGHYQRPDHRVIDFAWMAAGCNRNLYANSAESLRSL